MGQIKDFLNHNFNLYLKTEPTVNKTVGLNIPTNKHKGSQSVCPPLQTLEAVSDCRSN